MSFLNTILGNKTQVVPPNTGKSLADLVLMLANEEKTINFINQNHFNPTESERFRFCLLFFNLANVIFWVNYSQHAEAKNILDVMLNEIIKKMENDQRRVRMGNFIRNDYELALFDSEATENTTTTPYTIFAFLHDQWTDQYIDTIFQQMDLAFKARSAKNKDDFFALDPMGKLFVRHFTGDERERHPKLFLRISLLLSEYSEVLAKVVDKLLEDRPGAFQSK